MNALLGTTALGNARIDEFINHVDLNPVGSMCRGCEWPTDMGDGGSKMTPDYQRHTYAISPVDID